MKYGITYRFDCPICNSRAYLKKLYDAPKDVGLFEVHGLGRGKGFEYIRVEIDDQFRKQFQERICAGILMLVKQGAINGEYLKERLSKDRKFFRRNPDNIKRSR